MWRRSSWTRFHFIVLFFYFIYFFLFLAFVLLIHCTQTHTHIPYRILSLSLLLIHRIYTQNKNHSKRNTMKNSKKNRFYFYTFAHEMMGILVFRISWKSRFETKKAEGLPIVDQFLKCMPTESPVRVHMNNLCMVNENAWRQQQRGTSSRERINERTRADLSKILCSDIYFSSGFDVNVNVNVLLFMFVS